MHPGRTEIGGLDVKRVAIAVMSLMLAVGPVGCDEADEQSVPQQVDHEEYHSPFVIEGQGELDFETISFTDVGLNSPEKGPADPFVLETIAESLAYELNNEEAFDYRGVVEYDKTLKDPDQHLYCDRQHLYVALWRGYEPDRWGYSLWSGCHEQQKFEWREITDDIGDDADTLTWVEPLTQSIVDSVVDAHAEECFVARC